MPFILILFHYVCCSCRCVRSSSTIRAAAAPEHCSSLIHNPRGRRARALLLAHAQGEWQRAMCLVPVADMLNTGPAQRVGVTCKTDAEFSGPDSVLTCKASRLISANQEVHPAPAYRPYQAHCFPCWPSISASLGRDA